MFMFENNNGVDYIVLIAEDTYVVGWGGQDLQLWACESHESVRYLISYVGVFSYL